MTLWSEDVLNALTAVLSYKTTNVLLVPPKLSGMPAHEAACLALTGGSTTKKNLIVSAQPIGSGTAGAAYNALFPSISTLSCWRACLALGICFMTWNSKNV